MPKDIKNVPMLALLARIHRHIADFKTFEVQIGPANVKTRGVVWVRLDSQVRKVKYRAFSGESEVSDAVIRRGAALPEVNTGRANGGIDDPINPAANINQLPGGCDINGFLQCREWSSHCARIRITAVQCDVVVAIITSSD